MFLSFTVSNIDAYSIIANSVSSLQSEASNLIASNNAAKNKLNFGINKTFVKNVNRIIKAHDSILPQLNNLLDVSPILANVQVQYIKSHIQRQSDMRRKPGATGPRHLDPNKVYLRSQAKNHINIEIDIPGISRAFNSITIYPKKSKYLAIPLKPQYGAARTFAKDLFFYKTKAGNKALAYVSSGKLVVTHILKSSVFQPKDPTLLPDMDVLSKVCFSIANKYSFYTAKSAILGFLNKMTKIGERVDAQSGKLVELLSKQDPNNPDENVLATFQENLVTVMPYVTGPTMRFIDKTDETYKGVLQTFSKQYHKPESVISEIVLSF